MEKLNERSNSKLHGAGSLLLASILTTPPTNAATTISKVVDCSAHNNVVVDITCDKGVP